MRKIIKLFLNIVSLIIIFSCSTTTQENKTTVKEPHIAKDPEMSQMTYPPLTNNDIEGQNQAVEEIKFHEEKIESLENIDKDHEKRLLKLEKEFKNLNFQINDLNQDNRISKKLISQLKMDVQSLYEVISTNRKEIEIIKRGLRSGIFEDLSPSEKAPNKSMGLTMLPDMIENRNGFDDRQMYAQPKGQEQNLTSSISTPISANKLLASAELKVRQAQFGEAIVILQELNKNFPNYDDGGKSHILAAESWLKLAEYDKVFSELRFFYLKYPASPELAHAKLLEGQAFEKLNNKNKASNLFQEVIALSPQSHDAQNAREGLLRMRDSK